jgi:hypothetical protein
MSVVGTTQKQPRVFAHDAWALNQLDGGAWVEGDPIVPRLPTGGASGIPYVNEKYAYFYNVGGVFYRADGVAALYVGTAMTELNVLQEGSVPQGGPQEPPVTRVTTYHNVPAGTFMPISVLTVLESDAADGGTYVDKILALF